MDLLEYKPTLGICSSVFISLECNIGEWKCFFFFRFLNVENICCITRDFESFPVGGICEMKCNVQFLGILFASSKFN
jgi:hypothetical protein